MTREYQQIEVNVRVMPDVIWEPPCGDLCITIRDVTECEKALIALLSEGMTQQEASKWIGVSEARVSQMVKSIRRKACVRYTP